MEKTKISVPVGPESFNGPGYHVPALGLPGARVEAVHVNGAVLSTDAYEVDTGLRRVRMLEKSWDSAGAALTLDISVRSAVEVQTRERATIVVAVVAAIGTFAAAWISKPVPGPCPDGQECAVPCRGDEVCSIPRAVGEESQVVADLDAPACLEMTIDEVISPEDEEVQPFRLRLESGPHTAVFPARAQWLNDEATGRAVPLGCGTFREFNVNVETADGVQQQQEPLIVRYSDGSFPRKRYLALSHGDSIGIAYSVSVAGSADGSRRVP